MPFHPPPYFTLPNGSCIKLTERKKTIYAGPNPEDKPMLVSHGILLRDVVFI